MYEKVIASIVIFAIVFFTAYLFHGIITEWIYWRNRKAQKAKEAEKEKEFGYKEWVCPKHGAIKTGWTPAYYKTTEGKILFCPLCWLDLMDRECERLSLQTIRREE
jgi:hypothetical protein